MEDNSNGLSGLTFSQDLNSIFSQASNGAQDSTWLLESNSQVVAASQSTSSTGYGSQDSGVFDQLLPLHPLPPSFPAKKARVNVQQPRWTKSLMKTAEENVRQKEIETMMRRQEEDNRQIKTLIQEQIAIVSKTNPTIVSRIVKESTDFIISNLSKRLEKIQDDVMKEMLKHFQEMKQQNEDQLFEILASISATKGTVLTKLNDDSEKCQSVVGSALDNFKEFVEKRITVSVVDELKKVIDDKMVKTNLPKKNIPPPLYTSTPKPAYRLLVEKTPEKIVARREKFRSSKKRKLMLSVRSDDSELEKEE